MQFKSVESALERANSMVYNWKEVNLYVQNQNVMYVQAHRKMCGCRNSDFIQGAMFRL